MPVSAASGALGSTSSTAPRSAKARSRTSSTSRRAARPIRELPHAWIALASAAWLVSSRAIADIAHVGWVRNLIGFYGARDIVGYDSFPNVDAWLQRVLERPAVQRGLAIPARD